MPFLLLMPSYNQSHYIAQAVRSVLAQDDPDWQLWIVDNSTDSTPEVMRQFDDARIRFHHIPQRMDPGTCLNWMLERAQGRDFSYIHTDNNLHPTYVRRMRAALAQHPLALTYCDMRTIDETGRYLRVFKRGEFQLPRLLSTSPLGVPFAATTELARQVGGFSVRDTVDDVRFCVAAYGIARYIYIADPLVDYRNHGSSRTEQAGGNLHMQMRFADLMSKVLPTLEQRGLHPLETIEHAIRDELNAIDLFVEDLWHRKLSKHTTAWWEGYPRLDHFFLNGLMSLPGFIGAQRPPNRLYLHNSVTAGNVSPWAVLAIRHTLYTHRRELRRMAERVRQMLVPWACMRLGVSSATPIAIRIRDFDSRTLWAARQLQLTLGWTPLLDSNATTKQDWLNWGRAQGNEPLLSCSDNIYLGWDADERSNK